MRGLSAGTDASVAEPRVHRGFYLPALDVLRFVAFGMVFVFHSFPQVVGPYLEKGLSKQVAMAIASIVQSGAYGVDLFFIISSYLITRLLVAEVQVTGALDLKAFYVRRILRIWPLYFGFLLAGLALQVILHVEFLPASYYLAFSLFVGNILLAIHSQGDTAFGILWSLCIEEQFYIVWPLVVARARLPSLPEIALGLIAGAIGVRLVLAAFGAPYLSTWFFTLARLDPIALGVLIAIRPARFRVPLPLACCLAIAALPALAYLNRTLFPQYGPVLGFTAVAAVCALVVRSVVDRARATAPGAFVSLLAYLGKVSFGLYVFHASMIELALLLLPSTSGAIQLLRIGVAFAATVAAAILSYEFLEKPFLRLKLRFTHVASRPV